MSDYLPRASTTSAIGLLHADKAYRVARWHAAHGVPPDLAAQHGFLAGSQFVFVWLWVIPWATLVGLVYWTDNPWGLFWKASVIYLAFALWHRQKVFMRTDPRLRLCYKVDTKTLKTLWYFSWLFAVYLIVS